MTDANTLGHYHSGTYFRPDGSLYFTRTTPDWQHAQSLFVRRSGTTYGEPEIVTLIERWKTWREDLYVWGGIVSPDGSFVILDVSERNTDTGRPGPSDPWVTLLQPDGTWSEPRRMDALSSEGYDNFVFFSPDAVQTFFVRDFNAFYTIPLAAALASAR
jgi:hypothetical protein